VGGRGGRKMQQASNAEPMTHSLMLGPFKVRAIAIGTANAQFCAGLLAFVFQSGEVLLITNIFFSTLCCPHEF
jgi:hypothetical protein